MSEFARVIEETRLRRDEARMLLDALNTARDRVERARDGGAADAYKSVTGESSMERAIERMKRLVASFDRVIDDLTMELSDQDFRLLAEIEAGQPADGEAARLSAGSSAGAGVDPASGADR